MLQTAQIFKALADETRLRILNLLEQQELCVCQIMEVLGIGQSKISRHLATLRNVGLVCDRRDATWIYYSLAKPQGPLHKQILGCVKLLSKEVPIASEDIQALDGLGSCSDLCPEDSVNKKKSYSRT